MLMACCWLQELSRGQVRAGCIPSHDYPYHCNCVDVARPMVTPLRILLAVYCKLISLSYRICFASSTSTSTKPHGSKARLVDRDINVATKLPTPRSCFRRGVSVGLPGAVRRLYCYRLWAMMIVKSTILFPVLSFLESSHVFRFAMFSPSPCPLPLLYLLPHHGGGSCQSFPGPHARHMQDD